MTNTIETLRALSDDELTEIARSVCLRIVENPALIEGGKIEAKGVPCHIEARHDWEYSECVFVLRDDETNTPIFSFWDYSKEDPEECRALLSEGCKYCIGEVANEFDECNTAGWIDNKTARLLQAALGL